MADISFLFFLLMCFTSVNGQSLESIPSSPVTKKPGETLNLSCKGSGFDFGQYGMHWIRQSAGQTFIWMGAIWYDASKTVYAKSVEGRIEITRDNSNNMVYLKLSGLTTEDTAVYYCAGSGWWSVFDYWGKGTKVTVSSAQPSPPKSIFAMSQCTPDSTGFFTIGCMARGFSPADSLTFKWTDYAKKELSDVVQYPAFGSGEEYTKVSHVRISKSNWDPKNPYTCKASNSEGTSLEVKIAKAEAKAKAPDGEKPTVFIYRPDNINTDRVSHVCEVTSPKLGNVSVMWKVGNEPYIKGTTSAPIRQNDSTSVLSILTMTKQEYEKLSTSITCAVRYGNMKDTNAPLQVSTSKSKQPELSCD